MINTGKFSEISDFFTGEKPFKCSLCRKSFTASSNLYYHKMIHFQEKPHKCSRCPRSFPTPGDLRNHFYIHSGKFPFVCTCGRGFAKKASFLKQRYLLSTPLIFLFTNRQRFKVTLNRKIIEE